MLRDLEKKIIEIQNEIDEINESNTPADVFYKRQLENNLKDLRKKAYEKLEAPDRVYLARHVKRPNALLYVDALFSENLELKGDRLYRDDESIKCSIAYFRNRPVTIIAQVKGKTLEDNLKYNFGMPHPEAYRKVQRLIKQAEKFKRPVICFIDTPGAYPGLEAETRGQGEAIAKTLAEFSSLKTAVISVIIGEGGSGGALAIGMGNRVVMLENSIYSILSPEGFATILWKDAGKAEEASKVMKLTADELHGFGIVDKVIKEGEGAVNENFDEVVNKLGDYIEKTLNELDKLSPEELAEDRYNKFRAMGEFIGG